MPCEHIKQIKTIDSWASYQAACLHRADLFLAQHTGSGAHFGAGRWKLLGMVVAGALLSAVYECGFPIEVEQEVRPACQKHLERNVD